MSDMYIIKPAKVYMPSQSTMANAPPGPLDPATIAWINAVIANAGTVSQPRQQVVDSAIKQLRANGLFTKLDHLWFFAGENSPQALTDVINSSLATNVGGATFAINLGFTGNGSTSYVNTGVNPHTAGGNYALNSAHYSCYVRTTWSQELMGIEDSGDVNEAQFLYSGGQFFASVNNSSGNPGVTTANPVGMLVASRTSASARAIYVNGPRIYNDSQVSTSIPSFQIYVGVANFAGSPVGGGSSVQFSAASLGSGLTDSDAGNLAAIVNSYMVSVGANVY
jgi:hypothetical protein